MARASESHRPSGRGKATQECWMDGGGQVLSPLQGDPLRTANDSPGSAALTRSYFLKPLRGSGGAISTRLRDHFLPATP